MMFKASKPKVLVIADGIEKLNPQSDTTLYLMRAVVERGWDCFWTEAESLSWVSDQVLVKAKKISASGSRSQLPSLSSGESLKILDFSHILIRKEPPFDSPYQRLCLMLKAYENRISFLNSPSSLLLEHEKMIALEAIADGVVSLEESIDTCVTDDREVARLFAEKQTSSKLILKPWLGHGGRDIELFDRAEFIKNPRDFWKQSETQLLQPFHEAVLKTGDRRVLVMKGKFIGDVVRLPAAGGFVSNLVRGGTAVSQPLSSQEKNIIDRISPWLWKRGIMFAGLDFIDSRLSEVNVTCPTGLGAYENLNHKNLAPMILDAWLENS